MAFVTPPYTFKIEPGISKNLQPTTDITHTTDIAHRRLSFKEITGAKNLTGDVATIPPLATNFAKTQKQENETDKTTTPSVNKPKRVQQCVHPKLSVSDPVMMKHVKKPPMPICTKEEWLEVHNGTVFFSKAALEKNKSFTCNYFPLIRESESKTVFGEPIKNITNGFKMVSDFFKGVCTSETGENNSVVYSGVHYNENRGGRSTKVDPLLSGFEGLSIAILGFDSMSRMSWHRRLKKTREYFYETMKAIELKGHNIIGDGTTAVVLPMLTGYFEWELPECR
ncbi:hypothetical protein ElyMa_006762600 [Elysia marginata]|uniref:Uncharacterized protein n=1 Tax=Elysia marginata TaxID=1093978 RepID=A0AAV4IZM7_9GAST|nr:hypothetical protein ElyMa_006762600 [Elysia marginata]